MKGTNFCILCITLTILMLDEIPAANSLNCESEDRNLSEPLEENDDVTIRCEVVNWALVECLNYTSEPVKGDNDTVVVKVTVSRFMNGTSLKCYLQQEEEDQSGSGEERPHPWESPILTVHYHPTSLSLSPGPLAPDIGYVYRPGVMVTCSADDGFPEPSYSFYPNKTVQGVEPFIKDNQIMVHHLMTTGDMIYVCKATSKTNGEEVIELVIDHFKYTPKNKEGSLGAALAIVASGLIASVVLALAFIFNKPRDNFYEVSQFTSYRNTRLDSLDELAGCQYSTAKTPRDGTLKRSGPGARKAGSGEAKAGPGEVADTAGRGTGDVETTERYTTLTKASRMSDLPLPEYPKVQGNEYLEPRMWTQSTESVGQSVGSSQNIYMELEDSLPPPPPGPPPGTGEEELVDDVFSPPTTGGAGLPLPTSPDTPAQNVMTPLNSSSTASPLSIIPEAPPMHLMVPPTPSEAPPIYPIAPPTPVMTPPPRHLAPPSPCMTPPPARHAGSFRPRGFTDNPSVTDSPGSARNFVMGLFD